MVVDVKNQILLYGRDWMVSFGLNLSTILNQTLQVSHVTSNTTVIQSHLSEFSDVFKEELGVLKGIKAIIVLQPTAPLTFAKTNQYP